ncbi:MAG: extracellular solute-binding protein [Clostridium sp.]|nr:extracellular solute-binding protein [Clostridium sp.]
MIMGNRWYIYIGIAALSLCLAGCTGGGSSVTGQYEADEELVIYCPHPLEFINPIVSEFEGRTGIAVNVQTGGTGELLQMVEEGAEPRCDIFWGGSLSTTMPKQELFEPYISENEHMVREEFKNKEGNITRFTDVPSVLMVNTNLIGDLEVKGYEDLLNPELKGRIAMCSPVTSSSAYEHLINMLYAMGKGEPEAGWDYVEKFCRNLDGILLGGSSEVYRGVAEGRFAVGLTFEEGAAHYVASGEPVEIVYMEEGVLPKADVVCIVKGASHMEEAREFVNFVTGRDAQTVISARLDRRSVRTDVDEPSYLPDKELLHFIYDDGDVVNENKELWLKHFSELFCSVSDSDGGGGRNVSASGGKNSAGEVTVP